MAGRRQSSKHHRVNKMKSTFANTWNASVQRRKQRKYTYNAPHHTRGKFLASHLAKDLREKYGTRSLRVREGDKVKILRGSNKGKEGKVERVDVKNTKIYLAKMERTKPDGNKVPVALHPSSVTIIELNLDDKKRKAKLEKKD